MGDIHSNTVPADRLVLFGVTGDLARKKIFPALYATAKRGKPVLDLFGKFGLQPAKECIAGRKGVK